VHEDVGAPILDPESPLVVPDLLPVLPLKDTVVFPYIIVPLSVAREADVAAVDRALADDRLVLLAAQRSPVLDDPGPDDLHPVATVGQIMRMLKLPDGRIRILVQGLARVQIEHVAAGGPFLQAHIARLEEPAPEESLHVEAMMRSVKESLDRAAGLGKGISPEVLVIAANVGEPGRLADLVASNLELTPDEAQTVLEILEPDDRLIHVAGLLTREVQVLTVQEEISSQARGEMDRSQREYYLRQQLKAIQGELGEDDDVSEEVAAYRERAIERGMSAEAMEEMERQIRRLERSHPESAETAILRTYLDWLTALPWATSSDDDLDLDHAKAVLDEDHYGLERVKERILEYLAVRKLNPAAKGPILCFVGPPGVGKTSLGRSIARALGGASCAWRWAACATRRRSAATAAPMSARCPGRVLQGLRQAGTGNPVFMLDEIDKLGADFRGDPSSALLEVLDPEQNSTFTDHYLALPYDLSRVMFITTANLLDPIQPAFVDRMEVIRLTGYTEADKRVIARTHLIPKQVGENGLSEREVVISDEAVRRVIGEYTREAGLRNLERELAAICRKVAVEVARGAATTPSRSRWRGPPCPSSSARRATSARSSSPTTGWGWRPASPGRRPAAT
jgi:ATP-dependent Lon protease